MKGLFLVGLTLVAVASRGQGVNVDLDIQAGGYSAGAGVPSSSFGAAGNQPGVWNNYYAGGNVPEYLLGLDGGITNVTLQRLGIPGGVSGGSGWNINTGDYRLLLNDYFNIPDETTYRFEGLLPGRYQVYTYAVNATGETVTTSVDIFGQILTTTGPMPGNQLIEGITHTTHDVDLIGPYLDIRMFGTWPYSEVNGFQIVAVPEPATLGFLAAGGLFAIRRRRTSSFGAAS